MAKQWFHDSNNAKRFKSKYVKRKAIEPEANDDSDEISAQRVCA